MAIITIIFAAVLPQFRVILKGWDSRQAGTEVLQNGRVLIDHINRNLSKAVKITAVSSPSQTSGFIVFQDNDSNNWRYDINTTSSYVEFGLVGNLSDLAGPVSSLKFTCYDACDLNTPLSSPIDVNSIRLVKAETTLTNLAALGQNKTFTASIYLRANANNGGIVGCWKLDETSGTTAADSSGNGNNGTLVNMTAPGCWVPGQIGNALTFDGTNDYVSVSSLDTIFSNSSTFTVAGWFKTSQSTGIQTIVGNWSQWRYNPQTDVYSGWQVLVENNKVVAYFACDDTPSFCWSEIISTKVVNDGNWHHFALVCPASSNAILYVDGNFEGTPVWPEIWLDDTKFRIGDGSYVKSRSNGTPVMKGGPFNGIIDDVRLYNRALTATEIAQLANILTYRGFSEAKAPFDTNTSIAVPIPTGTSAGNLLIAAVATDGSTWLTTPAGWTMIGYGNTAGQVTLVAWRKIAGASESSPTFTWMGGQQAYGWMMRFSGQNAANPINTSATANQTSATPTSPAVTTTVPNCLILRLGAFDDSDVNTLPEPGNPGLSGHTAITMDKSSDNPVNPRGWWKLDETSGLTAADSSGYGNNGTFNGGTPYWVEGKFGGAVDFDGVNDYFSVPTLDSAYSDGNVFTAAGWFKTGQSTGIQTIVGNWSQWRYNPQTDIYSGWQVLVENNKVVAYFACDDTPSFCWSEIISTKVVNDGNWHHFALVRPASSNAILYVDGNFEGTPVWPEIWLDDTKFRIGDGSYVKSRSNGTPVMKGGPFNGIIDDVRIYDRALSATEIAQLAGGTVSGGAGYVKQSASGSSGTSNFSLGSSNEAVMITIAIAPDSNSGYDCCGDYLQP